MLIRFGSQYLTHFRQLFFAGIADLAEKLTQMSVWLPGTNSRRLQNSIIIIRLFHVPLNQLPRARHRTIHLFCSKACQLLPVWININSAGEKLHRLSKALRRKCSIHLLQLNCCYVWKLGMNDGCPLGKSLNVHCYDVMKYWTDLKLTGDENSLIPGHH